MFYKVKLEEGEVVEKNVYIFDIIRTPLFSSYLEEKYDEESVPIYDTDGEEKENI